MKQKINSDVTSQLSDAKTQLLHLAADFENYKRATIRREDEVRERATRRVLEELLPVLDNFERAVSAAKTTTDVNSLKIGVEYILQQFQEAIKTMVPSRLMPPVNHSIRCNMMRLKKLKATLFTERLSKMFSVATYLKAK